MPRESIFRNVSTSTIGEVDGAGKDSIRSRFLEAHDTDTLDARLDKSDPAGAAAQAAALGESAVGDNLDEELDQWRARRRLSHLARRVSLTTRRLSSQRACV